MVNPVPYPLCLIHPFVSSRYTSVTESPFAVNTILFKVRDVVGVNVYVPLPPPGENPIAMMVNICPGVPLAKLPAVKAALPSVSKTLST